MNFFFYRIRLKGTEKFYAGPRLEYRLKKYIWDGKEQCFSYPVTVGVFWRDAYFWSCKKKNTLKQHLSDIYRTSDFRFKDLEIEKCFVGKVEIVKETDIYSEYEIKGGIDVL